ncbi:MAG: hypothetical protein WBH76_08045 [Dictyoglomaceae bacterium]
MELEVRGFRYETFGLRKEWIQQLFSNGEGFFSHNTLGPKQFKSFMYFLRDCQLIDKKKNFTEFFNILKGIFEKEGINSKIIWGIIWINLCFNSPLFRWWANIPEGFYTRDDIINLLADSYGKRNTTIVNGYESILETLERSPIGIYFGQGIVKREGRGRTVLKEKDTSDIPSLLILYNIYKLSKEIGPYRFNIKDIEDNPLSPQKIFSLSSKKVESIIGIGKAKDFFDIDFGERKNYIALKNNLEPIDILKTY